MTTSLEQSFKKRVQFLAKERNLAPAEVWQNVISERFLVRLCQSTYQSHFILKGGMLLAKHVKLGRETKDPDFAIENLSNEIGFLQQVLTEIGKIETQDGFVFLQPRVTLLEHLHMEYPGARIKMEVHFGKAKFPLFIDLGFGDLFQSTDQEILLLSNSKGPLFETSITLKCYPIEFVFAEKLETILYRGSNNSRMKDFHDLYTLTNTKRTLAKKETAHAIRAVFNHRKTPLQIPLKFETSALESLQKYWSRYRESAADSTRLPLGIDQVIVDINHWLKKTLQTDELLINNSFGSD